VVAPVAQPSIQQAAAQAQSQVGLGPQPKLASGIYAPQGQSVHDSQRIFARSQALTPSHGKNPGVKPLLSADGLLSMMKGKAAKEIDYDPSFALLTHPYIKATPLGPLLTVASSLPAGPITAASTDSPLRSTSESTASQRSWRDWSMPALSSVRRGPTWLGGSAQMVADACGDLILPK